MFEDNSGAIYVATGVKHPKMRQRTKHINIKYHHFRNKVMDGTLSINQVATEDMLADILSKNCTDAILLKVAAVDHGMVVILSNERK